MSNGVLLWRKPTESGLGDRLIDLFLLLGLARSQGRALLLPHWGKYHEDPAHPAHRREDIKLENVLNYLQFPVDCLILQDGQVIAGDRARGIGTTHEFPHYLG